MFTRAGFSAGVGHMLGLIEHVFAVFIARYLAGAAHSAVGRTTLHVGCRAHGLCLEVRARTT